MKLLKISQILLMCSSTIFAIGLCPLWDKWLYNMYPIRTSFVWISTMIVLYFAWKYVLRGVIKDENI